MQEQDCFQTKLFVIRRHAYYSYTLDKSTPRYGRPITNCGARDEIMLSIRLKYF